MSKGLILAAMPAVLLLAGTAHAAPAPAPATWARCAVCHDNTKGGPNKIGPNLYGVVGKKAGTHAPTFKYSDGLKKSGLTWNAATLDKWIENPRALVPGTMMSFPGLKDPAKRAELVGYLTSLK
jgi:cytochrome c